MLLKESSRINYFFYSWLEYPFVFTCKISVIIFINYLRQKLSFTSLKKFCFSNPCAAFKFLLFLHITPLQYLSLLLFYLTAFKTIFSCKSIRQGPLGIATLLCISHFQCLPCQFYSGFPVNVS